MQTRLPGCQALRLLWAFDFDGVVCHSAKELCITGMGCSDFDDGSACLPMCVCVGRGRDGSFGVVGHCVCVYIRG